MAKTNLDDHIPENLPLVPSEWLAKILKGITRNIKTENSAEWDIWCSGICVDGGYFSPFCTLRNKLADFLFFVRNIYWETDILIQVFSKMRKRYFTRYKIWLWVTTFWFLYTCFQCILTYDTISLMNIIQSIIIRSNEIIIVCLYPTYLLHIVRTANAGHRPSFQTGVCMTETQSLRLPLRANTIFHPMSSDTGANHLQWKACNYI